MSLKPFDSSLWDENGGDVGDWCFLQDDTYLVIRLPEGTDDFPNLAVLRIKPYADGEQPGGAGAVWTWDGNREAPTLTPSILHHSTPEWHGYLTAGKLVPA